MVILSMSNLKIAKFYVNRYKKYIEQKLLIKLVIQVIYKLLPAKFQKAVNKPQKKKNQKYVFVYGQKVLLPRVLLLFYFCEKPRADVDYENL